MLPDGKLRGPVTALETKAPLLERKAAGPPILNPATASWVGIFVVADRYKALQGRADPLVLVMSECSRL